MRVYYNDFDRKICAWLRRLIQRGLIPAGEVDDRSITEIQPDELRGYTQCHFFAGIGGWAYALELAGWGTEPVWTGSCPCQPYSAAGKRKGNSDERNLWPHFYRLIRACRPDTVFGEQVASADTIGKVSGKSKAEAGPVWLDGVQADLEREGYSLGAAVLGAHSVGAPHQRQRLFWVAESNGRKPRKRPVQSSGQHRLQQENGGVGKGCCGVGDPSITTSERYTGRLSTEEARSLRERFFDGDNTKRSTDAGAGLVSCRWVGDSDDTGSQRRRLSGSERAGELTTGSPSGEVSFWSNCVWLPCQDGKQRRVPAKPSLFPLAARLPGRLDYIRGIGNSIVPQVAAEFIRAYREVRG